ncbi:hypothetical protein CPB83DRAFT_758580 [Crepidotus variabilis]|uniref:polynucleotide adenylyltransferase n=1 Tax=Crepidotus variabilis TaxID=179855 RepID=A0A9P6JUA8_9AGAR|nr:hypothetical protein CPB83DRAFT_758580 [Crepidotus variabilis]
MATSTHKAQRPSNDRHGDSGNRRSRRREKSKDSKKYLRESAQDSVRTGQEDIVDGGEPGEISIFGAASKPSNRLHSTSQRESSPKEFDLKGKGKAVEAYINSVQQTNGTFADGEDYIAFNLSDSSDYERRLSEHKDRTKDQGGRRAGSDDEERTRKRRHDDRDDRHSSRAHERPFDRDRDERTRDNEVRYTSKYVERKCPWVRDVDLEQCQNVAELMHREVEAFVDWISPSPVEDEIRGLIVENISRIVKKSFPDAQVHPFGSYQTKLYLPEGDIDLVIISDSMAYSDKTTVLHVLANSLKRGGITSQVTIIAKARVPILKFTSKHGRFKVDMSINQQNGLVSGNIITGFLRDMIPSGGVDTESKALRSLVMITKAFLSQRGMNEVYTGGLGSYSVVCLAVSFLQMHPKIRRGEIDPEKNLGVLVMEFFELYGLRFNYDEVGISLREGGTYFGKKQRGWHADYKRNMLAIEDPADPSNDISSGSYHFHKVRTAFAGAHGILTSTAYLRAGMLSSRQQGRTVRLRDDYNPEDLSMLSTVMGITQETINHRKLVQELYEDRTLHDILGVQSRATPAPVTIVKDVEGSRAMRTHKKRSSPQNKPPSASGKESSRQSATKVYGDSEGSDGEIIVSHINGHQYEQDDEDGRYAIGRPPPKKRRRTGKQSDAHTVIFVGDEDDEHEEGEFVGFSDSEKGEDEAKSSSQVANGQGKTGERRSYWLSKGKGVGGVEDDSR